MKMKKFKIMFCVFVALCMSVAEAVTTYGQVVFRLPSDADGQKFYRSISGIPRNNVDATYNEICQVRSDDAIICTVSWTFDSEKGKGGIKKVFELPDEVIPAYPERGVKFLIKGFSSGTARTADRDIASPKSDITVDDNFLVTRISFTLYNDNFGIEGYPMTRDGAPVYNLYSYIQLTSMGGENWTATVQRRNLSHKPCNITVPAFGITSNQPITTAWLAGKVLNAPQSKAECTVS